APRRAAGDDHFVVRQIDLRSVGAIYRGVGSDFERFVDARREENLSAVGRLNAPDVQRAGIPVQLSTRAADVDGTGRNVARTADDAAEGLCRGARQRERV